MIILTVIGINKESLLGYIKANAKRKNKKVQRYRPCQYIHEIHQIHVIALSFIKTTIFLKYAIICMINK